MSLSSSPLLSEKLTRTSSLLLCPHPLPPPQKREQAAPLSRPPRVASLSSAPAAPPAEMRVASDVTQLIGNTPMVYLNRIGKGLPARIAAKVSAAEGREKPPSLEGLLFVVGARLRRPPALGVAAEPTGEREGARGPPPPRAARRAPRAARRSALLPRPLLPDDFGGESGPTDPTRTLPNAPCQTETPRPTERLTPQ